MLRHLSQLASKQVPSIVEKVGTITALGPSPGSYAISIEGNVYNQVWSINMLLYSVGMQVKVIFDRGSPTIVP